VAGASIEAGVIKCVRVCWGRQRGVQRTKGRQQVTYSCKEAAHRDVDYKNKNTG